MNVTPLIMIAVLMLSFWLLVLRPAKAKQVAQQNLVNQLRVGDRIMTTAGLFGYVAELHDDEVEVEIAAGVRVRMVKLAIGRVFPATEEGSPAIDSIDISDKDSEDISAASAGQLGTDKSSAAGQTSTGKSDSI